MHEPQMCMMCMVLSLNCCAVTIFEYSTTKVTLPSCQFRANTLLCKANGRVHLDLVKLAKKRKSVCPALFRGNVCI